MFAFIDESGNTGPNLFDPEQPVFYSVAVISKRDLDVEYATEFLRLANSCGASSLHAAELGVAALEKLLPEIQRMVNRAS
jgi:NCAIR mutase (PurE)-related protein